jgi:hypothetical protein
MYKNKIKQKQKTEEIKVHVALSKLKTIASLHFGRIKDM